MKGRGLLPWLGLGLVVVLVLVVLGAPDEQSNRPLDPASAGPLGSKAVVVLLEELGAEVRTTGGPFDGGLDTALLLEDHLGEDAEDDLEDWVEDGGVLVVADRSSRLFDTDADAPCPSALAEVESIAFDREGRSQVRRGDRCFAQLVTTTERGDGTVVSIDRTEPFTNFLLGEADNAVLVAALLAPSGDEEVGFVVGSAGGGDEALVDVLGPRVAQGIVQLAVAFVLYALWRARRLGRAVVEPQPVQIAGSELVAAVGRLHQGRGRPAEVAEVVRADLLRDLERRLGVPAGGPIEPVAQAVAARAGMHPDQAARALRNRPVHDEADLLPVLDDLDRIRAAVLAPQPTGGT